MRFYTDISRLLPTSSIYRGATTKYALYRRAPNRPAILTCLRHREQAVASMTVKWGIEVAA